MEQDEDDEEGEREDHDEQEEEDTFQETVGTTREGVEEMLCGGPGKEKRTVTPVEKIAKTWFMSSTVVEREREISSVA